jgi:hypothetical protein
MSGKSKTSQYSDRMNPFTRFQNLIRGLVAVPKKEVEIELARWRADRSKKKKSAS